MADPLTPLQIFEKIKHLSSAERAGVYSDLAVPDSDRIRIESWVANTDPVAEGPGSRVGPYKLLQLIGEGGFGSVYMADQDAPVKRRVAIKIIKPGMDSRAVIARFEAERQALALMDHPNIARVLDAGATAAGRPYFVMELVNGEPITEYADRHHMNVRDRLELLAQVCLAVQHAHQKGIIHRDIKPTNVLVSTQDGKAFAKVIDFGIAKALAGRLTDRTLFTEVKQLIGTPQYMSPEQAEGSADIDTRSDVYSLGVLLYELLTGFRPFDDEMLKRAAQAEVCRIICDVDPPKPSTRLSGLGAAGTAIAAARSQQIDSLTRQLRSELEWIPMMALRKDKNRRYASPLWMAEDIKHYLNDRPLQAAPESWIYVTRKAFRRNRRTLVPMMALLLVVFAGTVLYIHQVRKARFETEKQLAVANAYRNFLQKVLSAASPFEPDTNAYIGDRRVSEVLTAASGHLNDDLARQPDAYAALAGTISDSWFANGDLQLAEDFARRSFEKYRSIDPSSQDTAYAFCRLFHVLSQRDEYVASRKLLDSVGGVPWVQRIRGKTDPAAILVARLNANLLDEEGRITAAESQYRSILADLSAEPMPDRVAVLDVKAALAYSYATHDRLKSAISMYSDIVEQAYTMPEEQHRMLSAWMSLLGQALMKEGTADDLKRAERLLRKSLQMRQMDLNPTCIEIINSLVPLAQLLDRTQRTSEASDYWDQALKIARAASFKEKQRWTFFANYAAALRRRGLSAKADAILSEEISALAASGATKEDLAEVQSVWAERFASHGSRATTRSN